MSTSSERSDGSADGYSSEEEDYIFEMLAASLDVNENSRGARWVPQQSGMEWIMETMANDAQCRSVFRLRADQIHALFGILTHCYDLHGSHEVCPMEALGIFLYIMTGGYSNRATNNRMLRLGSTVSIYFHKVLNVVHRMATDIMKPIDPNNYPMHYRVRQDETFLPFRHAVGAVDGRYIPVIVPSSTSIHHRNHHHETSRNVMVIIGWDSRLIFAYVGWPDFVHGQRVLSDTVRGYPYTFPRIPFGKYFLVDSGYACRYGFLPLYPHVRYHMDDFNGDKDAQPVGKEETFNHMHSALRNIVERAFGVMKNQWQILRGIPLFPEEEDQTKIIFGAFAMHNFRLDSDNSHF